MITFDAGIHRVRSRAETASSRNVSDLFFARRFLRGDDAHGGSGVRNRPKAEVYAGVVPVELPRGAG